MSSEQLDRNIRRNRDAHLGARFMLWDDFGPSTDLMFQDESEI
jgi:hypothetical protein